MNNLGKIKLLPAREQVASVLRKAILTRELNEGQEITLEDIATLAIFIAELLSLEYATSSGVITLLTIQNTKRDTLNLVLKRVLSFLMTIILAIIICYLILEMILQND